MLGSRVPVGPSGLLCPFLLSLQLAGPTSSLTTSPRQDVPGGMRALWAEEPWEPAALLLAAGSGTLRASGLPLQMEFTDCPRARQASKRPKHRLL